MKPCFLGFLGTLEPKLMSYDPGSFYITLALTLKLYHFVVVVLKLTQKLLVIPYLYLHKMVQFHSKSHQHKLSVMILSPVGTLVNSCK